MAVYTAKFTRSGAPITIPGLDFMPRESDGIIDIHYGRSFDKSVVPQYNCGPYTVEVFKDGEPFKTFDIPNHFWASNWWFELVPATIKRSPKFLIENGYVPPFGDTGIKVDWGTQGELKFPGPMGMTPGNAGYEPTTGGRPGIGIVTTEGAVYLVLNDPRDMLEQAKSGATQPIWFHDESTGKVIDPILRPLVTSYSTDKQGGAPNWLGPFPQPPKITVVNADGTTKTIDDPNAAKQLSTPQTAHMEDLAGLAALATGAHRYLRWVQMRVEKAFNSDIFWHKEFGGVTVFRREMRGVAWLMRELFYCYWATWLAEQEGPLPPDLLPSSTWKKVIDNQVTQWTKFVETEPGFQKFGIWASGKVAWWQADMVNQVLGLYARKWPEQWGPIYIKTLRNLMARVNGDGKNEWPVACPSWYWGFLGPTDKTQWSGFKELWDNWSATQASKTDPSGNNNWLTAEQVAALNSDHTNGGIFVKPTEYESWCYGALAYAVYNDRSGPLKGQISAAYPRLEAAFTDFHTMMKTWVDKKKGYLAPQCSISVAPKPIDPEPPTGEIEVSDPAFNAPFTATVAFKDNHGNPMVPDTVAWNAPAPFALTADQTNKLVAHGFYGAEGAAVIQATGVKDGVSVTVTKEVTVPPAPPFLATGEISLT